MTGVSGGTFAISAVSVASDGILYACNLISPAVSAAAPFKIYRWDDIGSAPVLAVSSGTITGGRMGDNLDVTGSGNGTLLVVYDLTTPSTPALVAFGRTANIYHSQGTAGPGTGSVQWGKITDNSATLYALSTNNGIQAFTVTIAEPPPFVITTVHLNSSANTLETSWNSVSGRTYRVEVSGNMLDWTTGASVLPADASGTNTYTWTILPAFTYRTFVRVVQE